MILNVGRIRKAFGAAKNFLVREQWQAFDGADGKVEFTQPVEVQVKVTNLGHSLLVNGQMRTGVKLTCSRCLEEFSFPVETEFTEEFCHTTELNAFLAEHPEADEEEGYWLFSGDEVDLEPLVKEQISLALPMKPLCREACQGLCPQCGSNLNLRQCGCETRLVDPRLADLAKFFAKQQ